MDDDNKTSAVATGIAVGTAIVAALFVVALTMMGGAEKADARSETIQITGAYAAESIPGQPNSAAYFTIRNTGTENDRLVAARSSAARVTELHTHEKDGDIMRMKKVASIPVPAGESVAFKPGGLHVMLIGLTQPLETGDQVAITLAFEKAGTVAITAPVRKRGGHGGHDHGHNH